MAFNDPIAELLTKIRNAQLHQHVYIDIWISKMKISIISILKEKGYVSNFLVNENKRKMRIFLKYNKNRNAVIRTIKRISKPGRRKYVSHDDLPRVLGGIGTAVISTSHGVMDDTKAQSLKVGGEVLLYIW
ncbi:MAG: 30S ribosomal protein S8 [Candidatus Anoxychlamydiales bacterium]|nr:30S ribosomal protein S8 [Candidatus Anoxychlamydiales bacterium]